MKDMFWEKKAYIELTYTDGEQVKLPFQDDDELRYFFDKYYDSETAKCMRAGEEVVKVEFATNEVSKLNKVLGKQTVVIKYTDGVTHTYVFNNVNLYGKFMNSRFIEYMEDDIAEVEQDDYMTKGYSYDSEGKTICVRKDGEVVERIQL